MLSHHRPPAKQRNAISMAFRWRAVDGRLNVFLPFQTKKKKKKKKNGVKLKLDPL